MIFWPPIHIHCIKYYYSHWINNFIHYSYFFIFILWQSIRSNPKIVFHTQTSNSIELLQNIPPSERSYSVLLINKINLIWQVSAVDLSSTCKLLCNFCYKIMTWPNIYLQDRASPITEQLILFHDHALIINLIISSKASIMSLALDFLLKTLFGKNVRLRQAWPTVVNSSSNWRHCIYDDYDDIFICFNCEIILLETIWSKNQTTILRVTSFPQNNWLVVMNPHTRVVHQKIIPGRSQYSM
jgi:hypothetical protein